MTGLLRTSLVFFLPIFLGFFFYHSWQTNPGISKERREAFLAKYDPIVQSVEKLAETSLASPDPTAPGNSSADLAGTPVLLVEGVQDGVSILRLLNPVLADDPSWNMVPEVDGTPSFATGFRFSTDGNVIKAFLIERTIYDDRGNPVALNIYIREEDASHDVSP